MGVYGMWLVFITRREKAESEAQRGKPKDDVAARTSKRTKKKL